MNITIITNVLPYPLQSGGAQAQFNILDVLRKKHNISIIFTQDGQNKISAMRELMSLWPEVHFYPFKYIRQMCYLRFLIDKAERAFKLKFMYDSDRFKVERALKPYGVYFSNDFKRFINKIICKTKSDIVQVEFFPCLDAVECIPENVKKVFIHHEIRFVRNQRLLRDVSLSDNERRFQMEVKVNEIKKLNCYDAVVTLTETDKNILEQNGVKVPVFVSPAAINAKSLPYEKWNGKVIFIGGYKHAPNKEGIDWFLKEVLPKVRTNVSLNIIGTGWPMSYENENVKLLGFVDNIETVVSGSIMLVPILTGSGMRMKILEAAAMSVPFVTTSVGVEGLDFRDKESCLIADTPDDFAKAIELLFSSEDLRERLSTNASKIFNDKYSVQILSKRRDDIYQKLYNKNSII